MVIRIKTSLFVASRARSFVASRARSFVASRARSFVASRGRSFVASRARRQGIDKNSFGRVSTNNACVQIRHNYYSLMNVQNTSEVKTQTCKRKKKAYDGMIEMVRKPSQCM